MLDVLFIHSPMILYRDQEDALRKAGKPATDFYMSGDAAAGIQQFMPANPQSLGDRTSEVMENHVPTQLKSGRWVIADPTAKQGAGSPLDGWRYANAPAGQPNIVEHPAPGMTDALAAEIKTRSTQVGSMKPGAERDTQVQLLQELKLRLQALPK